MCERLCALSNNEIVKRRKPLTNPLMAVAAGSVVMLLHAWLSASLHESLALMLVVLGWSLLLIGGGLALVRLFAGEGVPYCPRTKRYLKCEELYFPKERMREVLRLSSEGDFEGLRALASGTVPAVVAVLYFTEDGRIGASQCYEYVELEYRPLEEMHFFRR